MSEQLAFDMAEVGLDVPQGYKRTEVGVIPEDWDVIDMERAAAIIDPQPDHRTPPESANGEPYIGISDFINNSEVDWESSRKIISKAVDKQKNSFKINKGDIIFGKIGTIGSPKFAPQTQLRYALSANVILLQPKIESHYLMSFFESDLFQKKLHSELHSTSQAAFGINKMRRIKIPLPPKSEQTAIATALSDVDALINELEQLIAKKQAIKTATMQQLLTGRTRLPLFALRDDGSPQGYKASELGEIPEDWELVSAGSVCDLLTGFPFPSQSYSSSGVRLLRGSNVKRGCTDWDENITQYWPEVNSSIKAYELRAGDIVISMDGSLVGRSFAQLSEQDLPALLLQRVARLRSERVSQNYLKEWICSSFFIEHCDSVKTVTAIPHISPEDIRIFKFLVPPTLEEQTAIASILSDMDSDISNLQQRLSKYCRT